MNSLEEQIRLIEDSPSLDSLPLKAMPPIHSDSYYFASYSHKDYKAVYKDILLLQKEDVPVWYDRGLPAGKDWEEIAGEYIAKANCLGIIFYLSKNALESKAIRAEMETCKLYKKDFVPVVIGCSDLQELISECDLSKDDRDFILDFFDSKIIYLDINCDSDKKAEKIRSLKREPLLRLNELGDMIIGVNSIDITHIEIDDPNIKFIGDSAFTNCTKLRSFKSKYPISYIFEKAFYNCYRLEKFELPELEPNSYGIERVGKMAFANCYSLKEISLPSDPVISLSIDPYAFRACKALTTFKTNAVVELMEGAFQYCYNLKSLKVKGVMNYEFKKVFAGCNKLTKDGLMDLMHGYRLEENDSLTIEPYGIVLIRNGKRTLISGLKSSEVIDVDEIGDNAFERIEIEELNYTSRLKRIGDSSFMGSSLKRLHIKNHVTEIGNSAFFYCQNLIEATIESDTNAGIGSSLFVGCSNLKKVDLSNCLIEQFPSSLITNCANLEEIKLSSSTTDFSYFYIKDLKKIKTLDLRYAKPSLGAGIVDCCINTLVINEEFYMSDLIANCEIKNLVILKNGSFNFLEYPKDINSNNIQCVFYEGAKEEFADLFSSEEEMSASLNSTVVVFNIDPNNF